MTENKNIFSDNNSSDNSLRENSAGCVCIVPLTSKGDVVFIERCDSNGVTRLEAPSGTLEGGETPLEGAVRILMEHTGHTARCITSLAKIILDPESINEAVHMYLATELDRGKRDFVDNDGHKIKKLKLNDAINLVMACEINEQKTQVALMRTWFTRNKSL